MSKLKKTLSKLTNYRTYENILVALLRFFVISPFLFFKRQKYKSLFKLETYENLLIKAMHFFMHRSPVFLYFILTGFISKLKAKRSKPQVKAQNRNNIQYPISNIAKQRFASFNQKHPFLSTGSSIFSYLLILGTISYFLISSFSASAAAWWNDSWNYRKQLTIDHTQVAGNLTDFPVLISLNDADLSVHAQDDGDDLVFTLRDGTILEHEIENYSSGTGALVAWVKVPSLSSTADTDIFMYYGNAGVADQSDAEAVWDDGFKEVWHLDEDQSGAGNEDLYQDSTATDNDGDDEISATDKTGKIGSGQNFDGSDDHIEVGYLDSILGSTATMSFWIKTTQNSTGTEGNYWDWPAIIANQADTSSDAYWGLIDTSGHIGVGFRSGSSPNPLMSADDIDDDQWHHVAITRDSSTGAAQIFLDGQSNNSGTIESGSYSGTSMTMMGKGSPSYGEFFDGNLDEVHISDEVRDAAWIETEFNNQDDPEAFLSGDDEETSPDLGGPIGYWSFDEGYGTTAYNESGQDNNGTISGAVWQDESMCVSGKCLYFDGSDDYVNIADAASLNMTNMTIAAWVKSISAAAGKYIIAKDPPLADSAEPHLTHLEWTEYGRKFSTGRPGEYTLKTAIGQKNVHLADGSYAPYHWDEEEKVLYFADSSIRMGERDWEVWHGGEKVREIDFSPEMKKGDDWLKEEALASNFRIKENGSDNSTELIEISYDLETANQKATVTLTAGGSERAQFAFDTAAKVPGEYRLAVQQDNSGLEPVFAQSGQALLGWQDQDTGFAWKWNEDEPVHYAENRAGKVAVLVNQGQYLAGEMRTVFPDTIAPTISAETDDGCESGGWTSVGFGSRNYIDDNTHIGLSFVFPGALPASAIVSGAYVRMYNADVNGGTVVFKSLVEDADPASAAMWSSSHLPSGGTWIRANSDQSLGGFTGSIWYFGENDTYPVNLAADVTDMLAKYGDIASGNRLNVAYISQNNGGYCSFWDHNYGSNYAEFSITYTDGGTPSKDGSEVPYALSTVSGGQVMFKDNGTTYAATGTTDLDDGNWHYVAGTFDGDELKYYVDGNLETTDSSFSGDLPILAGDLRIGADYQETPSNFFQGFIDEVKAYPYARSADQIKQDYNAGQAGAKAGSGTAVSIGDSSDKWLSDGLMVYYKMDEAAGTYDDDDGFEDTIDSSGNGNTGDANGDSDTASGKFGNGGTFDGDGDYIEIADLDAFDSFSFWIRPGTRSGYDFYFVTDYDGAAFQIIADDHGYLYFSSELIYLDGSILDMDDHEGVWSLITVTLENDQYKLYFNGELAQSGDFDPLSGSHPAYLGEWGTDWGSGDLHYFNGQMDEVRVYNRALSANEVRQLYKWAPGPVAHWKMDEKVAGDAQTIYDVSGNENHGTTVDGANDTGMDCSKPGKYGSACEFDGVDDYVEVSNNDSLLPQNGSWSMQFWANPPNIDQVNAIIDKSQDSSPYEQYYIGFGGNNSHEVTAGKKLNFGFIQNDESIERSGYTDDEVVDGNWHNYAVVANKAADAIEVYVDGISKVVTLDFEYGVWPTINNADELNIGLMYSGLIDDVRIYNYARTQEQIIEDMNAGHPVGGSPVGSQVAYWKFDEGVGGTAYDSVGDNDGTLDAGSSGSNLTETEMWSLDGKYGKAIEFDGTDDYVEIINSSEFDFDDELSYSAWVKIDNCPAGAWSDGIIHKYNEIMLSLYDTTCTLRYSNNGPWVIGPTISAGTWNHVAVTFTDSTDDLKFYINGELETDTTETTAIPTSSGNIFIGSYSQSSSFIDGLIDEVKIYNTALTAEQVRTEYNQGKAMVMGQDLGRDNDGTTVTGQSAEYCVPGDTSQCDAPVVELKMDEKEGTTAYDTSGNGNNGTLGAGTVQYEPSWARGKFGSALSFDGTDDRVSIVDSTELALGQYTVSAWVNVNAGVSSTGRILERRIGTPLWYVNYILGVYDDGTADFGHYYSGVNFIQGTTDLRGAGWKYVVGTYDGSSIRVYVDGVEENSAAANAPYTSGTQYVTVGWDRADGAGWFDGSIDQIRVYNYARTPAQIAWDYNKGAPIAEWRFDETSGTTAHDESGNGNDGTLTNMDNSNWVSGQLNNALDFDGSDDYVSIAEDPALEPNTLSISAWVYRTGTGTDKGIAGKWTSDDGYLLWLGADGDVQFAMDAVPHIDSGYALPLNQWVHIMGTYDGTSARIYVNGELKNTGSKTLTHTDSPFEIGRYGNVGGYCFPGVIDDVKLWNYPLTAEQIREVMNQGAVSFN